MPQNAINEMKLIYNAYKQSDVIKGVQNYLSLQLHL